MGLYIPAAKCERIPGERDVARHGVGFDASIGAICCWSSPCACSHPQKVLTWL